MSPRSQRPDPEPGTGAHGGDRLPARETEAAEESGLTRPLLARAAIVLLLAAFGALYTRTVDSEGMLMWDEAEYASLARSLAQGDGYTMDGAPEPLRPPVLPLGGAISILATGRKDDVSVKWATIGFALLALLVVYAAAAYTYDEVTGLLAAAMLGLMPWFWITTSNFLSEIPLLAFLAAAIAAFYHGCHTASRYLYLAWLGFGLALLTRYTALLFGPIAVGMVGAAWLWGETASRRRLFSIHMAVAPAAAILVLVPWFAREQLVFGNALIGVRRAASQLSVYLPGVSMPWYFYLGSLGAMMSMPILLLAAVGAVFAVRTRDRFALHCLGVALGVLTWFSCYRYKEVRLISSILPFLAIVAAAGVSRLVGSLNKWETAAAISGLVAMVLAFTQPVVNRELSTRVTLGYPSFLDAMGYLREHSTRGDLIIGASYPQIWWYAERRVFDFPARAELGPLLDRTEWVVITNFERGQKKYVRELARAVNESDVRNRTAIVFRDAQWGTMLVRASLLRGRL